MPFPAAPAKPRARNPCRGVSVCVCLVVVRGVCCVCGFFLCPTSKTRQARPLVRKRRGTSACFFFLFLCCVFCSVVSHFSNTNYSLLPFACMLPIVFCCYRRLANVFHSIFISKNQFFTRRPGSFPPVLLVFLGTFFSSTLLKEKLYGKNRRFQLRSLHTRHAFACSPNTKDAENYYLQTL